MASIVPTKFSYRPSIQSLKEEYARRIAHCAYKIYLGAAPDQILQGYESSETTPRKRPLKTVAVFYQPTCEVEAMSRRHYLKLRLAKA